jgi:hypothetical protein
LLRLPALDEQHERGPDFGSLMPPKGAEELEEYDMRRMTALIPKQVSGWDNAPALRFASVRT